MSDSVFNPSPSQKAVLDYIKAHYSPSKGSEDNVVELTTKEIHQRINETFPDFFTAEDLVRALISLGFTFTETNLTFSWQLLPKPLN